MGFAGDQASRSSVFEPRRVGRSLLGLREMLLRWAGSAEVDDVDWDSIRFKMGYERYRTIYRRFNMPSPLAFSKANSQRHFETAPNLEELIDSLEGDAQQSDKLQLVVRTQSRTSTN